jgi:hypothetical protein
MQAWIVPIVVVFFYIVSAVLKARQESEAKPVRKSNGGRGGTELDRFLEEIERLKRDKANRPDEKPDVDTTAEEKATAARQKKPVVVRLAPANPRLRPVVVVAPPPAPPQSRTFSRALDALIVAPVVTPSPNQGRGPTPAVMSLLRHHKGLATAFVLQEVFGPPKCLRK